jgi:hypothetical protein
MNIKLIVALFILALLFFISIPILLGTNGFGPTNIHEVTVNRLYVDYSGGKEKSSHYMVGTNKGVFEVNNGLILFMWNADELYSTLKEGKRYSITTKGNKVVNIFFQEYPYIIAVRPIEENK